MFVSKVGVVFCIALFICTSAVMADSSEMLPSPEQIRRVVAANEQAIRTFQGHLRQRQQIRIVESPDGRFSAPSAEPQTLHVIETDFVHDLGQGDDYYSRMIHSSPLQEFREPVVVERRNGGEVEGLIVDRDGNPTLGIIPRLPSARYLGNEPRNLLARNNLFILSSAYESGYRRTPLSELLVHSEQVHLSGRTEQVDGHECVRLAVTSPEGEGARLTFFWLGTDVGLNIVKQQSCAISGDEANLSELAALIAELRPSFSLEALLERRLAESTPDMIIVNQQFTDVGGGILVPAKTLSYVFSAPDESRVGPDTTLAELQAVGASDPNTAHLRHAIVRGYIEFVLDMKTLKINEYVDPATFTTSIIPEGVPVSNFILGIHPRDLDRVSDEKIKDMTGDLEDAATVAFKQQDDASSQGKVASEPLTGTRPPLSVGQGEPTYLSWWLGAALVAIGSVVVTLLIRRNRSRAAQE